MLREVVGRGRLDLGGRERHLDALVVDIAVAREADHDDLARAIEVREGEHDVLQRVRRRPAALRCAGDRFVRVVHERRDGRRSGRVVDDGRGRAGRIDRLGGEGRERLDVRGVSAGAAHECVFADGCGVQELLAAGSAHRSGVGLHDDVLHAEAREDALVGVALRVVARVEPGVGRIERVGVLHRELAAAQQTGAGARLIAVLVLDLVDRERQILI